MGTDIHNGLLCSCVVAGGGGGSSDGVGTVAGGAGGVEAGAEDVAAAAAAAAASLAIDLVILPFLRPWLFAVLRPFGVDCSLSSLSSAAISIFSLAFSLQ